MDREHGGPGHEWEWEREVSYVEGNNEGVHECYGSCLLEVSRVRHMARAEFLHTNMAISKTIWPRHGINALFQCIIGVYLCLSVTVTQASLASLASSRITPVHDPG